jgi:hypothetical protein
MERAENIRRSGFEYSENPWDWLGKGVYFFEAAPSLAGDWSRQLVGRLASKGIAAKPAVVSATLNLEGCIDLLDNDWIGAIQECARRLSAEGLLEQQHGLRLRSAANRAFIVADYDMPLASHRYNASDCQVINALWGYLRDGGDTAPAIRAPFVLGRQLYSNSFFFHESHVQIAVVDTSIMSDVTIEPASVS